MCRGTSSRETLRIRVTSRLLSVRRGFCGCHRVRETAMLGGPVAAAVHGAFLMGRGETRPDEVGPEDRLLHGAGW